MASIPLSSRKSFAGIWLVLTTPAVAMFLSSNIANAGNLVFNMLFSRWMGPELFADLATLLTLKLSLLAFLNAVQMAISQKVSTDDAAQRSHTDTALVWLNGFLFIALALVLPFAVPVALSGALSDALGIASAPALAILLLALPVTAPLCLARGVAIGRLDVARTVMSANAEMAVRLGGSVIAWQAGLGIEGVAAAMALSILVGWLAVRRGISGPASRSEGLGLARKLAVLSMPFAVLQAAQVAHLDGDILAANALLDHAETGLVAVLSLFQRIQFFACFGLAGVLLPSVAAAVKNGNSGLREAAPVIGLFFGVSIPLMIAVTFAPVTVLNLLSGPAFAKAADALALASLGATFYTASYLTATFLAALGDRRGIWVMAAFAPLQLGGYTLLAAQGDFGLIEMVTTKAILQGVMAATLILMAIHRSTRRSARPVTPTSS